MDMEMLETPKTDIRRLSMLWPILTFVFFLVTVVMISLCLWMVLKPLKPSDQMTSKSHQNPASSLNSVCPSQTMLYSLGSPLPMKIQKALHTIDDYLVNLVERPEGKENMSAMSIKIVYKTTTLWTGHYGSKIFKGSVPPDDDTRYRIGSVTKLFPVILLYKLHEDGLIASLDDPLSKYAPNFSIKNPFGDHINGNITLRQIASQMSGLPREGPCGYRCKGTTSAKQLALLKSEYLVVKPWTAPSYSNLGYALLGRLLTENLLNTTFELWVKEKILDPLGMKNTGFKITQEVEENMALPYTVSGKMMPFLDLGWVGPAGDMYSTIDDLLKLASIFNNPEKQSLLKAESIREMLLPDFITRDGSWLWGSPWEMRHLQHYLVRQKGGNIDSYNAAFSVIPEMKLAVSVLVNVASALKYQSFTCFFVTDFVHNTLLPALNQTLFDIRSKSTFPVPAKPFLGDFLLSQISMSTGKTIKINVTIKEDKDMIKVIPYDPSNSAHLGLGLGGFVLQYIGKPLMFRGMSMVALNSPCIMPHLGVISTVTFDPPGPDGLSKGFAAASWKIKAVRLDTTRANTSPSGTAMEDLEPPMTSDNNWLFHNPLIY